MDHLQWIMTLQDRPSPRQLTLTAAPRGKPEAEKAASSAFSRQQTAQELLQTLTKLQSLLAGDVSRQQPAHKGQKAQGAQPLGQEEYEFFASMPSWQQPLPHGQDMAAISRFFERDARRYG